ncbi:HNH endonuclease [Armatimonas sp.]|uniref:HNH endonuclease n=1 Tax=Armatimonas sp. TaxID=1872638 RepID=UPI003753CD09
MVFTRRVLTRTYTDYTRYRPFLRQDFLYRCAYCLRHEYFLGGEAGCVIDHHRPQGGSYARPDLICVYENLYWCCNECNSIKGDTWPSSAEYTAARRFLDPCQAEDDHDLHYRVELGGSLTSLTTVGSYTIENLILWREQLVYHRANMIRWQQQYEELLRLREQYELTESAHEQTQARLSELASWIEPPVFNRPRR